MQLKGNVNLMENEWITQSINSSAISAVNRNQMHVLLLLWVFTVCV